jgi:hypothetical protein
MDYLQIFLGMLMLVFAIASIIAGIFTAYFGSGKSRGVGAILIVVGLIVGIIFLWGAGVLGMAIPSIIYFKGTVIFSVLAVVGAIVGALIALGIFLLAIMKT